MEKEDNGRMSSMQKVKEGLPEQRPEVGVGDDDTSGRRAILTEGSTSAKGQRQTHAGCS